MYWLDVVSAILTDVSAWQHIQLKWDMGVKGEVHGPKCRTERVTLHKAQFLPKHSEKKKAEEQNSKAEIRRGVELNERERLEGEVTSMDR